MKILTAEAMRQVDRAAIEEVGIPSLVLMENAAIGVADAVALEFPEASAALIVCGPGNNGGDGLAVGRHLASRGYRVELWLAAGERDAAGDCAVQLGICRRLGLAVESLDPEAAARRLERLADGYHLLVDALFGTGLSRPLAGGFAELVEAMNRRPEIKVAVDLPSGLDASSPRPPGPHFRAQLTVAFGAPKLAHVLHPAARAAGTVVVADLGFPSDLIERAEGDLRLLEGRELAPLLPPRAPESHKGSYGHLLVIAGSEGKSGAAVLAARAALRAGAGLVTAAVPAAILPTLEAASLESMALPLPQTGRGGLAEDAVDAALSAMAGKQAVALGPGLGTDPDTREAVRRLLAECPVPMVVDADGLNALAGELDRVAERAAPTVLTPHPGELGRLLGIESSVVQADRLEAASRAAAQANAVVVLKGHQTVVADPAGGVAVNPTGNPGMASGGTGDALTGIVGALLARGLDAVCAAELGVYLHGAAGDLAAASRGETALLAGDLIERIGEAVTALAER